MALLSTPPVAGRLKASLLERHLSPASSLQRFPFARPYSASNAFPNPPTFACRFDRGGEPLSLPRKLQRCIRVRVRVRVRGWRLVGRPAVEPLCFAAPPPDLRYDPPAPPAYLWCTQKPWSALSRGGNFPPWPLPPLRPVQGRLNAEKSETFASPAFGLQSPPSYYRPNLNRPNLQSPHSQQSPHSRTDRSTHRSSSPGPADILEFSAGSARYMS